MTASSLATIHTLTDIDYWHMTATCSICGKYSPIYVTRGSQIATCMAVLKKRPEWGVKNSDVIVEYIQKHKCTRCGLWGLGLEKDFKFFELHLPFGQKIRMLARTLEPEQLIQELEKRDLYCGKCYPYIVQSYRENNPTPKVEPKTGQ
jgi:hypothetical protein